MRMLDYLIPHLIISFKNNHAPKKTKVSMGNHKSYISQTLKLPIMKHSHLKRSKQNSVS